MKIKLNELYNSKVALESLFASKLKISLSFRLTPLLHKIRDKFDEVEKFRQTLVKDYGVEVEDKPGQFTFSEENVKIYNQEILELMSEEVEVEVPDVSISDFGESFEISADDLVILKWLIKD